MHAPKNNIFAYVCCMLLGAVFILLGARSRFDEPLANIILAVVGAAMIIGYAVVIYRHLRSSRDQ